MLGATISETRKGRSSVVVIVPHNDTFCHITTSLRPKGISDARRFLETNGCQTRGYPFECNKSETSCPSQRFRGSRVSGYCWKML